MDKTATIKALHIDASEFEMPQDVKLAKIAKALAHDLCLILTFFTFEDFYISLK